MLPECLAGLSAPGMYSWMVRWSWIMWKHSYWLGTSCIKSWSTNHHAVITTNCVTLHKKLHYTKYIPRPDNSLESVPVWIQSWYCSFVAHQLVSQYKVYTQEECNGIITVLYKCLQIFLYIKWNQIFKWHLMLRITIQYISYMIWNKKYLRLHFYVDNGDQISQRDS